ncbi:MAG: bifunctional phosphopantothenoylcysteine decarboxylase/phosphopantothenate--cysteine ligase CoaBC [Flavobacteriales bacterium]|nr:MAG: bifunctional phosphopantothenoylcysteine decarboxylase/phosphopantothenate--cysteine ligase CoaBC [Flavobacteriales bacterium]
MSILSGKHILLGVSAGIAAYKTAHLVRLFVKSGAEVKVIMTPTAKDFVTPLTLATVSKNPVFSEFTEDEGENVRWNNHVALALWADYILIAPATANTLAKMADGTCNNLLLATYLSAKCPVFFAPAMDLDMYKHPTTKKNIEQLTKNGNVFIPAETGELASGLSGEGRMAEPENIIRFIEKHIKSQLPLYGKTVLITAGPTYEAIDPVRFIGNHSSGKMGFELAKAGAEFGAAVVLITGPTAEKIEHSLVDRIDVVTAEEMYQAVHSQLSSVDIVIMSAAVSDFKPKNPLQQKIKKEKTLGHIDLVPTKDILASVGKIKGKKFLVGFALETENALENAKDKVKKKNLDFIVLNSMQDKTAGFKKDTNKVTIINAKLESKAFKTKTKQLVAQDIFNEIIHAIC